MIRTLSWHLKKRCCLELESSILAGGPWHRSGGSGLETTPPGPAHHSPAPRSLASWRQTERLGIRGQQGTRRSAAREGSRQWCPRMAGGCLRAHGSARKSLREGLMAFSGSCRVPSPSNRMTESQHGPRLQARKLPWGPGWQVWPGANRMVLEARGQNSQCPWGTGALLHCL